jgi:hypothetical protein
LILRPIGPFPPVGAEAPGEVDLGVRLRDRCLCRDFLVGLVRGGLWSGLAAAVEAERYAQASELLRMWLESWPLAALVDPARRQWTRGASPEALGVLVRVSELVRAATAWPALGTGPWPAPDAAWLASAAGAPADGRWQLVGRGIADGSDVVAGAIAVDRAEPQPLSLPPTLAVAGELLAARRHELTRAIARGELAAVEITSPVPPDAASQLALGELRMESDCQVAYEQVGIAGLVAGGLEPWDAGLLPVPTGRLGRHLRATCQTFLLPGTPQRLRQGQTDTIGWLVWEGPHRPVAVHPVAVETLRAMDGRRDVAGVASQLGLDADALLPVVEELARVGALVADD